jgi:hypothetical protein
MEGGEKPILKKKSRSLTLAAKVLFAGVTRA